MNKLSQIECIGVKFTELLQKAGIEDQEEPEVNNCSNTNIGITEQDNVVIQHATNPVFWQGTYNETVVKIKYTQPVGNDGETETFTFIFNKLDGCLKIKRAFKFYDGKQVDVSAITAINVSEFYTGEWILDKKFTGNLIFTDPHDKKVYSRKFWLEFTAQNLEIENEWTKHYICPNEGQTFWERCNF